MKTNTLSLSRTPFTDLMLHPEKLAAVLQLTRGRNDAYVAARKLSRRPGTTVRVLSKTKSNPTSPT